MYCHTYHSFLSAFLLNNTLKLLMKEGMVVYICSQEKSLYEYLVYKLPL